jgi:WD40 repeat protein
MVERSACVSHCPEDRPSAFPTCAVYNLPHRQAYYGYGSAAIGGDGREVAAYLCDATTRELAVFDFETGALRARLRAPISPGGLSYMALSPDGTTIALGMEDGRLDLLDRHSGARAELRVSDGPVRAVAFLPDRGRVRIVAERRWISTDATRSAGHWAGPMRIADYAVRFPSP